MTQSVEGRSEGKDTSASRVWTAQTRLQAQGAENGQGFGQELVRLEISTTGVRVLGT